IFENIMTDPGVEGILSGLENNGNGIHVSDGANINIGTNLDGSDDSSDGNLIINNVSNGILIDGDAGNGGVVNVLGNNIGAFTLGADEFPNGGNGIEVNSLNSATTVNIGNTTDIEARNLISN